MKLMWHYMSSYKRRIAVTLLLKLLAVVLELLIPYTLEYMIDKAAPAKDTVRVVILGVLMIILALLARWINVTGNRIATATARDSIRRLRHDLFGRTIYLSGTSFDHVSLPSLISEMTSDSYNVQSFIGMVQRMGVRSPIMLVGAVVVAVTMDPVLSLVLVGMIPVLAFTVIYITKRGIPLFERVQSRLDAIVRIMRESIAGIRVIKGLSKEEYEKNRFSIYNQDLTNEDIHAGEVMALPGTIMTLFLNIGLTLVVLIGAFRVNEGSMEVGVILAFLTYFNMITMAVMGIRRIFMMYSKAGASADRIASVLELEDELGLQELEGETEIREHEDNPATHDLKIQESAGEPCMQEPGDNLATYESSGLFENSSSPKSAPNTTHDSENYTLSNRLPKDDIPQTKKCMPYNNINPNNDNYSDSITPPALEFRDVSFHYGGRGKNKGFEVSGVSFSLQKGESVGIIGATGSGKTTIINLLMRFYDVTSGSIYMNGVDIRDIGLKKLRGSIGIALQNDTIFNDTLAENIMFGRDISMEAVKKAADTSLISDYINSHLERYDYVADIKGMNLSGGQRQRLLIARALAGNPEYLILDDSSSALDYATDARLRSNLKENYPDCTCVVVAQRVSSVKDLTKIIVMEDGNVIGLGTHDELMRDCEIYKEIAKSQMGSL